MSVEKYKGKSYRESLGEERNSMIKCNKVKEYITLIRLNYKVHGNTSY